MNLTQRPVADPASFIGQKLEFRVTRFEDDRRGPNVVLSRRALLEEEARGRAEETRGKVVVGAVLPGVVTAIKDFGAFVDVGGIEGLLSPPIFVGFEFAGLGGALGSGGGSSAPYRPRLRMRSTMRPASASGTCRSRWTR